VFLKSLTLKGFKSFADTTTLDFEPGVTVVVGPNGSGKSNVVDAVAWVLGAQGPRTLRSTKMEDVIFAGTPRRPALGRAEVSLTIDNSSGSLPIEFSEVTITRTLFRSGDSEYAINRVPCRLLDVQELLSDSGVGRSQHVIVSQGNLDAVLTSRPEDRRAIIEEAAGVLKYRRRKERSERRLEGTEAGLLRLQDLLREVRRQLRPLEKQAEAARRHGGVVAELDALRRYLAGRDLAAVESRLAAAASRSADLAATEAELGVAIRAVDADVETAEAALSAARERTDRVDLAEAVTRAESLRARAQGAAALLVERRRSLERALSASADRDVISSLEAEAAGIAAELGTLEAEAAALGAQEEELARSEALVEAEGTALEERWRGGAPAPADPAAEVRGELTARGAALDRARNEARRQEARVQAALQRRDRLAGERARLAALVEELEAALPGQRDATEQAERSLAEAEADLRRADEQRRGADEVWHRWQARHEALAQALDQARARAGAERLAALTGVVGTLLELVQVDEGWEEAFEAATGEALAAVVVDGVAAASRALEELRRQNAGGAVVALPEPDHRPASPGPSGATGGELVRAHVRSRLPAVSDLLDVLLATAVCAPSWQVALELAAARPELVVVTAAGDRFAGGIWRTGSAAAGATGAAVEEAQARASEAEREAGEAARRLAVASRRLDEARAAGGSASRELESEQARLRSAGEALRRTGGDLDDAVAEARAAVAARAEADERLRAESARVAELESLLPGLEAEAAVAAERVLAERADRAGLAARAAAVVSARRDFEVKSAGLDERRRLLTGRLQAVEDRLARNVAERDEAAERRCRLEAEAGVLARLATVVERREHLLVQALARLREARRAEAESLRALSDRLEALRHQRGALERQLVETREQVGRLEADAAGVRVRHETLVEAVRRELDSEPESVRDSPCPPLPPGTSPASRRTELERELRLMGPINPLALEEHRALEERHAFLEAQLDDVRSARRELAKVIRAVDAEIVEVFRAAYADVADNFEKLFATLFPGGQGRLRLTDPDHPLDTGIEIEARPSGKNVRRLSLLSGGERSLTAMAFLFAVFRSRPSPFYLMDEVEAALDDVNLHRFLDLVHEFRSEAQLLIVSHQKRTMEAADCLYGVTMPPGGSSRVVSERVTAARPA